MSLRKRISELSRESNEVVIEEIEEHKLDEILEDLNNKADDLNKEYDVSEEIAIITSNIEEVQGGIQATLDNSSDVSDVDVAVAEAHLQQIAIRCGFADSLTCESIEYFKDGVKETLSLESYNYANGNREKLEQIGLALEGIGQTIKNGIKWVFQKLAQFFMAIVNFFRKIFSPSYRAYEYVVKNDERVCNAIKIELNKIAFGERSDKKDPKEDRLIKHFAKFGCYLIELTTSSLDINKDKNEIIKLLTDYNAMLAKVKDVEGLIEAVKQITEQINKNQKQLKECIMSDDNNGFAEIDQKILDTLNALNKLNIKQIVELTETFKKKMEGRKDAIKNFNQNLSADENQNDKDLDINVDTVTEFLKNYLRTINKDTNDYEKIVTILYNIPTKLYQASIIKPFTYISELLSRILQGVFTALSKMTKSQGKLEALRILFKVLANISNGVRKLITVLGEMLRYYKHIAETSVETDTLKNKREVYVAYLNKFEEELSKTDRHNVRDTLIKLEKEAEQLGLTQYGEIPKVINLIRNTLDKSNIDIESTKSQFNDVVADANK